MEFFKRYFKCVWQRKILFITLLVIGAAIGLVCSHKIYNPSHEYYSVSFKADSVSDISLETLDMAKQKIQDIRENGKYLILNDYLYEVDGAISAEEKGNSLIVITYNDNSTENIYGAIDTNVFDKDGKNYIILDDYWLYPKGVVTYNDGIVSDTTDEGVDTYIAKTNMEYQYSYSSFAYVKTKKLNKTSYVEENDDNTYTLYMQRRYFNTWQQARRFMVRYISYIAENKVYILNDSNGSTTTSITDATKAANILGYVDGTNIYLWSLVGAACGIALDLIIVLCLVLIKKEEAVDRLEYDNEEIFKTPFHKNYWKGQLLQLKSVKNITFLAILLAMMQVVRFIPIPSGFGNLGISLSAFFFALIGLIYGPSIGFIIGIISDIFGFFVFPDGYPFHPGYTIQAGLTGLTYGLLFYKTKVSFSKVLFARLIVNIVLNGILGSLCWGDVADLSREATRTYMFSLSIPKNVVYLLPQSIAIWLFFKALAPALKALLIVDSRICDDINHEIIDIEAELKSRREEKNDIDEQSSNL